MSNKGLLGKYRASRRVALSCFIFGVDGASFKRFSCVLQLSHHERPTGLQRGSLLTYVGRVPYPIGVWSTIDCVFVGPHTLSGPSGALAHLAEAGSIGLGEPTYHY